MNLDELERIALGETNVRPGSVLYALDAIPALVRVARAAKAWCDGEDGADWNRIERELVDAVAVFDEVKRPEAPSALRFCTRCPLDDTPDADRGILHREHLHAACGVPGCRCESKQ